MLDDRKKKVLKAIVEEYINTAEPVGSIALTQNGRLREIWVFGKNTYIKWKNTIRKRL